MKNQIVALGCIEVGLEERASTFRPLVCKKQGNHVEVVLLLVDLFEQGWELGDGHHQLLVRNHSLDVDNQTLRNGNNPFVTVDFALDSHSDVPSRSEGYRVPDAWVYFGPVLKKPVHEHLILGICLIFGCEGIINTLIVHSLHTD